MLYKIFKILRTVLLIGLLLMWKTGLMQSSQIDARDLQRWERDSNGVVLNAGEFSLDGRQDTCWYLIHGYTATPNEMQGLAQAINDQFGDKVVATRLKGSGELPSKILDQNLFTWYEQVEGEFLELKNTCKEVNVAGFSIGGALASNLAIQQDVQRLYLIAPYLTATYKPYYIFRLEQYLNVLGPVLNFVKKSKIAQINDPKGLESYISFWNMPFEPMVNSRQFFEGLKAQISKLDVPVLLQHSKLDTVSDLASSQLIFDKAQTAVEDKKLTVYTESNHCLLADYDAENVITSILEFDKAYR